MLTGAVAIDEELLHINPSLNHGFRYKGLQIAIDPIEEIFHIREYIQTFRFG